MPPARSTEARQVNNPLSLRELPRTLIISTTILPCAVIASCMLLLLSPIQFMALIVERDPDPLSSVMRDTFWPINDVLKKYSEERRS